MILADIRTHQGTVELIAVRGQTVYFYVEKNADGKNGLFLMEYDTEKGKARVIKKLSFFPACTYRFFEFPDSIGVITEYPGNELHLFSVNKRSGNTGKVSKLGFYGTLLGCRMIDEDHLLYFCEETPEHKRFFLQFRSETGLSRMTCLYDTVGERSYYVLDPRFSLMSEDSVICYDLNGQAQLLFLQTYGDEREKEYCYKNREWMGDGIRDDIRQCPLIDFTVAVKSGETHLPLEPLLGCSTDGLVRFAGMTEDELFFRARYFPTNDQRVFAVDKHSLKTRIAASLNLLSGERNAAFYVDARAAKVYRIEQYEKTYRVCGVLNSAAYLEYSREAGDLISCVEDRFAITRRFVSDQTGTAVFYCICDTLKKEEDLFECRCEVYGNMVVLF